MKTRLAVPALVLVLLAMIPAAQARVVQWGIGADLGYNLFMPSSDYEMWKNINAFGWPMGGSSPEAPTFGGLRVVFRGEKPTREVWLGTSLALLSSGNVHANRLQLTVNYQYNFPTEGRTRPYVTGGAGLTGVSQGSKGHETSAMGALFGVGMGVARSVTDGAGRLRAEMRFDRETEGKDGGSILIPKGWNLGFRLGFDLWVG
jgi:opacity protein-like surface antigen